MYKEMVILVLALQWWRRGKMTLKKSFELVSDPGDKVSDSKMNDISVEALELELFLILSGLRSSVIWY